MRVGALTFGIAAAFALELACTAFAMSSSDAGNGVENEGAAPEASGGSEAGDSGSAADGDAGPGILVLVTNAEPVTGVAADEAYVYWTERVSGIVGRVRLDGGPPMELPVTRRAPGDIAVTSDAVFWANGNYPGTVFQAGLDGSGASALWDSGTDELPQRLAVTPTWVVVSTYRFVTWVNRGGSMVMPQGPYATSPYGVASAGESAFWSESNTQTGHVWRAESGTPMAGQVAANQVNPESIAVYMSSVAWVSCWDRSLSVATVNGGSVLKASIAGMPISVAADSSGIYVLVERPDDVVADPDGGFGPFGHASLQQFSWNLTGEPRTLLPDITFDAYNRAPHKVALTKDFALVAGYDTLVRVGKQ